MLNHIRLQDLLLLDLETVPAYARYEELPDRWKHLWNKKAALLAKNGESPEEMYPRAGIYAEFGKVICASVGIFSTRNNQMIFRVKSYYGHDEAALLRDLAQLIRERFNHEHHLLVAHNGKEFDFPYLGRRMVIQGIDLPPALDISGKKPWEVKHLDTMDLWKFGDFKSFTSLELLAAVFDIPTPKDDIDGSQVYGVYYEDKDLERIRVYCEKDVVTLANVLLKMRNQAILTDDQIESAQS